jgi:hypothetical protein
MLPKVILFESDAVIKVDAFRRLDVVSPDAVWTVRANVSILPG